MKIVVSVILLVILSLSVIAQEHCIQFPAKKINIIANPSFEDASEACFSNYIFTHSNATITAWTNLHEITPIAYVDRCSNFSMTDKVLINDYETARRWFKISDARSMSFSITFPPVMPLPLPNGNAALLITDKAEPPGLIINLDSAYIKSYAATCLLQPLQKDSLYRLDFSLGFGQQSEGDVNYTDTTVYVVRDGDTLPRTIYYTNYSKANNGISNPQETIAIYGKQDCKGFLNYPYFKSCPVNQGWVQLGSVTVNGTPGNWVRASIPFIAPANMSALAIGPGCQKMTRTSDTSYFYQYYIDDLQMYKPSIGRPSLVIASGSLCDRNVTLQLNPAGVYKATDLQWFKNNIPIAGASGDMLHITANGQGYYQCRVQNDTVCLYTDSMAVFWQFPPPADLLGKTDTTLCLSDSIVLHLNAGDGATYRWQDGSTDTAFKVTGPGTYSVTVTNACGPTTISKKVNYRTCLDSLLIPTAFTPNGDGKNDYFRPSYYYTIGDHYNLTVFNRYGQLLFTSNNIYTGWDGTYKGILQPSGTYIYQVSYKRRNDKTYYAKGTITLIR